MPIIASLTHQLVELLGYQVVESQREATRQRQQELMVQHLSTPLAAWLTGWPATGGSMFERLQLALRRIPPAIDQLDQEMEAMKYARKREDGLTSEPGRASQGREGVSSRSPLALKAAPRARWVAVVDDS